MRVVEAAAGGIVAAIVVVLIASRVEIRTDLVIVGAVAFLVGFLAVMLRTDSRYVERGKK